MCSIPQRDLQAAGRCHHEEKGCARGFKEGLAFEKDNKPKFAKLAFEKAIDLDPEESDYKQARDRVRGQLDTRLSGYELKLSNR